MIQTLFEQHYYLIFFVSFMLGLLLMPIVSRIAKTKGFVVHPNERMSHEGEVPDIGGLNICFSFLLTYLLFNQIDPIKRGSALWISSRLSSTFKASSTPCFECCPSVSFINRQGVPGVISLHRSSTVKQLIPSKSDGVLQSLSRRSVLSPEYQRKAR